MAEVDKSSAIMFAVSLRLDVDILEIKYKFSRFYRRIYFKIVEM